MSSTTIRRPDVTIRRAHEAYTRLGNARAAGKELGCSDMLVLNRLRDGGYTVQERTKIPPLAEIIALYEELGTTVKVAERLGCHASAISRRLKRGGYKVDGTWGLLPRDPSEFVAVYHAIGTKCGTEKHYGVSEPTVTAYMKKHGINTLPRKKDPHYICPDCGKELRNRKPEGATDVRRCQECRVKHHRGVNHHHFGKPMPWATGANHYNWKGGLSYEKDQRSNLEYRRWREAVYERDGEKCAMCGSTEKIVAHHIIPFWQYKTQRHRVPNGIVLCRPCHGVVSGREIEFAPLFYVHRLISVAGFQQEVCFRALLELMDTL